MIGTLINKFENLATNTVADFNKLFTHCPLDYPDHYEVEIGELFSEVRQLIVNGEIIHHDLRGLGGNPDKYFRTAKPGVKKPLEVYYADQSLIGKYQDLNAALADLELDKETFEEYMQQKKIFVKGELV